MPSVRLAALFLLSLLMIAPAAAGEPKVLPTDPEKLSIMTSDGTVSFSVELALTPEDRASGLMFRRSMAADHGMLFRFERSRPVMMWMKNTPLSLDMLFIARDGTVVSIASHTTPFSTDRITSGEPASAVLELLGGSAERLGIAPGDVVRHFLFGSPP